MVGGSGRNGRGIDPGGVLGTTVSRRTVLRWSGTAGMMAVGAAVTNACAPPTPPVGADLNGCELAPGFTSRVIASAGSAVPGTGLEFRAFPDGAATFVDPEVPGGWYHTVNHEIPGGGGVTSIRFAPDGTIVGARSICDTTSLNCAGGATPWGTWLTCEEWDFGHVWECDPTGATPARMHPKMGAFSHEAAAVASDGNVYLTEDKPDGAFYRYTPATPSDLSDGVLAVATGATGGGPVTWVPVPHPDPDLFTPACRNQVPGTMRFEGGEGAATSGGTVWFSTKRDERIWEYDIATSTVTVRYQAGGASELSGVDNVWVDAPSQNLFIAEDGDDMQVVMLRPDNSLLPIVRLPGQDHSEITGPCFSPDGRRFYFSSQRAQVGPQNLPLGRTYEITGPFDALLGRP